jgi:hypothetical protein
MSNPKKHDSRASGGGLRPTADAPESSANAGGGMWSAKRKVSVVLELPAGTGLRKAPSGRRANHKSSDSASKRS